MGLMLILALLGPVGGHDEWQQRVDQLKSAPAPAKAGTCGGRLLRIAATKARNMLSGPAR